MYTLVKSVCLARSIGSQWKEIDLSNILVFDIFTTYSKVYMVLEHPSLSTEIYVDMDTLRTEFSSYSDTLSQLLIDLDNRTLTTVDNLPDTEVRYVKYSDAARSGYKVNTDKIGSIIPENYPELEKPDLVITRPNFDTDLSLIHSHCLISVNGMLHRTDTDGSKAYVYEGATTMRKSRLNHLGIISFLDVGTLTKVPLLIENILTQDVSSTLSERVYFSIEEDLTDKSFFLVLGGYLVFPDEHAFWLVGEKTFTLDLNHLFYIERLCESNKYLDLKDLELSSDLSQPSTIDVTEVLSDEVIKRYMTLSQSYLVIVDSPNLITNKIHLRHSHLPGMFTAYQDPVYPLLVNYGKLAEYWKTHEDGHWSVTVEDSFLRNFVLSQQPIKHIPHINDNLLPHKPYHDSMGYLLEIAGFQ